MANIVELRELGNDKLQEMLENAREELFNLRFQNASARLEDYSRLKHVRREIAQLESTLNMRQLAEEAAAAQPEIMAVLAEQNWQAMARFIYEDSAWRVEFADDEGNELATAMVNLNKKNPRGRRARRRNADLVISYEIAE
jgi:large subunit ribosomal protein L29